MIELYPSGPAQTSKQSNKPNLRCSSTARRPATTPAVVPRTMTHVRREWTAHPQTCWRLSQSTSCNVWRVAVRSDGATDLGVSHQKASAGITVSSHTLRSSPSIAKGSDKTTSRGCLDIACDGVKGSGRAREVREGQQSQGDLPLSELCP